MQEENKTLNVIYEARRQARGPERDAPVSRWKRRLLVWGVAALLVVGAGVGLYLRWLWTRVAATEARVCAAVVALSADIDARLQEILVQPGAQVTAGQPLARLDDSGARATLAAAEAQEAINESLAAQTKTQQAMAEARLAAQVESAARDVEIARARVAAARADLNLRQARLPAEIRRAEAERDSARAALERLKHGSLKEEIEAAEVRLASEKEFASLYEIELRQTQTLFERKIESQHATEVARTQLATQRNRVRESELALERLKAGPRSEDIDATGRDLAAREAALALTQSGAKEVESFQATLALREAELRKAESEQTSAADLKLDVALARERVAAAEAELRKAHAAVEAQRTVLRAATIVSPVAGTVMRTFYRPGELCRKGDTMVLVADDSAGRWVECYVRERDALQVRAGQKAAVEMLASDETVRAEVAAIGLTTSSLSRGSLQNAAAISPAAPLSELVWVKLTLIGEAGKPLPGMSARVVIYLP